VSESPFLYLTVEQIETLHAIAIEEFGGRPGILDVSKLQLVARVPYDVWLLEGGDIWEQAAAYAHSLTHHPPYQDGNKRTALACTIAFLEINGCDQHNFAEGNLFEAIVWLGKHELTRRSFAQYLRDAYDGTTGTWGDEDTP
jgi:death-on-curing protein